MSKRTTLGQVIKPGHVMQIGPRHYAASCGQCWARSPLCMGTLRGAVRMLRRLGWMEDKRGTVRCPACGRRFKFSISRRPIEQGGSHRISGECDCGRVRVWGTAGALFERVPGVDEETEADVA